MGSLIKLIQILRLSFSNYQLSSVRADAFIVIVLAHSARGLWLRTEQVFLHDIWLISIAYVRRVIAEFLTLVSVLG